MSGICGILSLDGRPVAADELEVVLEPLRRRGPDGHASWLGGVVALGHTSLATTPEALIETLPLSDPASGCSITADARIDNRDELLAALGVERPGNLVGDGELILCAYLKWGEDCVDHLLGDFAFAIWDGRRRRLFCARDQIGMRQLHYWHQPGRLFVFATEPAGVLAYPLAPRRINEARIADFLVNLEPLDLDQSFFQGVSRLPPAHVLTVDSNGTSRRRYWRPEPEPELMLRSDGEYAEAFLEVFETAVRCRLRSPRPIGSMLSGGMDSTAIAAVAARHLEQIGAGPLQSFSALGPDPETCPETRAIQAAMTIPNLAPSAVNFADLGDHRDDLVRLVMTSDDPFEGWMGLVRTVYLAARRSGINVVLDGAGADITIGAGWTIAYRWRKGRIVDAARESLADARFWGPNWPAHKTFLSGAWRAFSPWALREIRHQWIARFKDPAAVGNSLISDEFARAIDLPGRRRRWRAQMREIDGVGPDQPAHWSVHPRLIVARERYDRVASALAIEPRDPFCDRRLIQFGLRLPAEQRQSKGWPKFILRNALAGLVPDAIRWRRGKEHLGRSFVAQLFPRLPKPDPEHPEDFAPVFKYVDAEKAATARRAEPFSQDFANWQDVVYLALWLDSVARLLQLRSGVPKERTLNGEVNCA